MAIDPFEEFRRKQAAKTPLAKPTLSIKPKVASVPAPTAAPTGNAQALPTPDVANPAVPQQSSAFTTDRYKKEDVSPQSLEKPVNIDEHRVAKEKLRGVTKPDNIQKY